MDINNFLFGYVLVALIAIEGIVMMISGKMFLGKAFVLGWRNKYSDESVSNYARKAGFPILLFSIGALIMIYIFDHTFIPWALAAGFVIFLIGVIGYVHCHRKYLKKENN